MLRPQMFFFACGDVASEWASRLSWSLYVEGVDGIGDGVDAVS